MWAWVASLSSGIKLTLTIISRVIKLEGRVTVLEKEIKILHAPAKDARDGLVYNKTLNLYENKLTGENFCPTCLGNNKRVAVQLQDHYGKQCWNCYDCKSRGSDGKEPRYPSQADSDYNPFKF